MYPLVAIFLMSFWQDDEQGVNYALPLVVIGAAIAFYHNLLYYKILPESAAPCVQGISCTSVHIEWFGFITIPLLSFISFALIAALITLIKRKKHE
jgi:disulfide bond formation protein DsbB